MDFKKYIASIPDFPQPGVLFRDITPLMSNGEAFHAATSEIQKFAEQVGAEVIAGPESRGFIFGCPVAANLHIGFVPQAGQAAARNDQLPLRSGIWIQRTAHAQGRDQAGAESADRRRSLGDRRHRSGHD